LIGLMVTLRENRRAPYGLNGPNGLDDIATADAADT